MKKTFAFVFCLVMSAVWCCLAPRAYAQRPDHQGMQNYMTSLTIVSDQQAFWVFIDDVQQNDNSTRSIRIERVPAGEHYLRVEMDNNEHITFGQYIMVDPTGTTFHIDIQRHLYGFSQYHGIPRAEQVVSYQKAVPQPPQGPAHEHHGQPLPHQYGEHPHSPDMHQHAPAPAPFPMAMNEMDFQRALSVIKSEDFENTKLSTAKQVASNNLLTVNQISRICQLFEFDNTRLDFAKTAYSRCVDQHQYYLLHSVFEFDSNKKELDKFVQQQK